MPITSTNLRINYLKDTGMPAFYTTRYPRDTYNYSNNKLRSEYGYWLEEKLGKSQDLRLEYKFDTGYYPFYKNNDRTVYKKLSSSYCLYLEEKILKLIRN
jgi:hypothetical protein